MDFNTYNQHLQSLFTAQASAIPAPAFLAPVFPLPIDPLVQWVPSVHYAPGGIPLQNNNAQLAQLLSRELAAIESTQKNGIREAQERLDLQKKTLEAVKVARQYFESYGTQNMELERIREHGPIGYNWNIGGQAFAQAPGVPTMVQAPNSQSRNQEPSRSIGRTDVPEEEEPEIDFSPPSTSQRPTEKKSDDIKTELIDVKEEQEEVPEMPENEDRQIRDISFSELQTAVHQDSQCLVSEERRINEVDEELPAQNDYQSEEVHSVKQEINETEDEHVESRDTRPLTSSASSKMDMDGAPTEEEQKPERQSIKHQFEDIGFDNWTADHNLPSTFEDATIVQMEKDVEQNEPPTKRGRGRPKKDTSGRRGRPTNCSYFGPKNKDEVTDEEDKIEKEPTTSKNEPPTKRGKGRPKKEKKEPTASSNEQPQKRGRPPKSAYYGPHLEGNPSTSEGEPPMKRRRQSENSE